MSRASWFILAVFFLLGCGSSNPVAGSPSEVLRPAPDAPESFSGVFADTGTNDCQSRMIDPVDQVELLLVRSVDGLGDYLVPMGKYRLSADELLRINCRTGKVLGIVKK